MDRKLKKEIQIKKLPLFLRKLRVLKQSMVNDRQGTPFYWGKALNALLEWMNS